jgi:hypothetical protein
MQLRFVKSESTFTYFEATRGYLEKHGKPLALYSDKASVFRNEFMADYNRRFAKAPRHDFDVHRPLETDDNLVAFFTWREPRRVSKSLTVQYDKVLYLIEDNELSRRAIGKYIDVWHYPDGRKELRLNGDVLPYSTYDRLQEIDQGAIVDNKRLGRTLEFIKLVQDKRDNNRSQALPAGDGPSRRRRKPTEKKSQRSLNGDDMLEALKTLQSYSEEIFGKRKYFGSIQRSRNRRVFFSVPRVKRNFLEKAFQKRWRAARYCPGGIPLTTETGITVSVSDWKWGKPVSGMARSSVYVCHATRTFVYRTI